MFTNINVGDIVVIHCYEPNYNIDVNLSCFIENKENYRTLNGVIVNVDYACNMCERNFYEWSIDETILICCDMYEICEDKNWIAMICDCSEFPINVSSVKKL